MCIYVCVCVCVCDCAPQTTRSLSYFLGGAGDVLPTHSEGLHPSTIDS